MAKSAIEKFISSYIRNIKINSSKEGYEAWLRKNGLDPTVELSDRVAEAYTEKAKISSPYSSTAEALAESGLSRSGYAKYLEEAAGKTKNAKVSEAIGEYLKTDNTNKLSYDKELEALEEIRLNEEKKAEEKAKAEAEKIAAEAAKKEQELIKKEAQFKEKLIKNAKAKIEAMTTIDYDKAYKYATEMGLDERSAKDIAKSVTDAKRSAAIAKITNAIISKHLTKNQTREYAIMLGLSEKDASALADFAFKTNESVADIVSQDKYLDYLQNQINNQK